MSLFTAASLPESHGLFDRQRLLSSSEPAAPAASLHRFRPPLRLPIARVFAQACRRAPPRQPASQSGVRMIPTPYTAACKSDSELSDISGPVGQKVFCWLLFLSTQSGQLEWLQNPSSHARPTLQGIGAGHGTRYSWERRKGGYGKGQSAWPPACCRAALQRESRHRSFRHTIHVPVGKPRIHTYFRMLGDKCGQQRRNPSAAKCDGQ